MRDDPSAILAADFGRVFCLALFILILAYSVWTIKTYAQRWHTRKNEQRNGNLPLHVWLVALSYVLLAGEAVLNNVVRLGQPASGYLPYNAVVLSVGVFALFSLHRSQDG